MYSTAELMRVEPSTSAGTLQTIEVLPKNILPKCFVHIPDRIFSTVAVCFMHGWKITFLFYGTCKVVYFFDVVPAW
jgi:hypothetical protein